MDCGNLSYNNPDDNNTYSGFNKEIP